MPGGTGGYAQKGGQVQVRSQALPQYPSPPPPPDFSPMPQMNAPVPQAPVPVAAPPPTVSAPPINIPATPQVHAAQTDPNLADYLARVKARLDNSPDDTRALNQMGIAVNQFAQGQRNNAVGDAARRGVLGVSGAEGQVQDDIGARAQGDFARGAESIAIQRMRDNDAFLQSSMPAFAEPGRQGLADRGLGIQAQGQANQMALSQADMQLRAQMANQQAAQQASQQSFQQQLAAAQMAQQQQQAMMQMWANLYR